MRGVTYKRKTAVAEAGRRVELLLLLLLVVAGEAPGCWM